MGIHVSALGRPSLGRGSAAFDGVPLVPGGDVVRYHFIGVHFESPRWKIGVAFLNSGSSAAAGRHGKRQRRERVVIEVAAGIAGSVGGTNGVGSVHVFSSNWQGNDDRTPRRSRLPQK